MTQRNVTLTWVLSMCLYVLFKLSDMDFPWPWNVHSIHDQHVSNLTIFDLTSWSFCSFWSPTKMVPIKSNSRIQVLHFIVLLMNRSPNTSFRLLMVLWHVQVQCILGFTKLRANGAKVTSSVYMFSFYVIIHIGWFGHKVALYAPPFASSQILHFRSDFCFNI